jgi:hypothetical protein
MGYGIDPRGTFTLPCQIGHRTVYVQLVTRDDTWRTIGSGTTTVRTGKTSRITIRLTEDPRP